MPVELRPEGGNKGADLTVDRADSAEVVVMFGHLQQALAGDVPAPRHVLQKRQDVFKTLRAAETDDEDRVVRVASKAGSSRESGLSG